MNPVKKLKLHIHRKIYGKCREMKEMPPLTQYTLGDAEKLSLIYPVYVEIKKAFQKSSTILNYMNHILQKF